MLRGLYERLISVFFPRGWYAARGADGEWVWQRYNAATRSWEVRAMTSEEADEAGFLWSTR